MASKKETAEKDALCPLCGKRISPAERAGSLTSYLFQPFDCTCSRTGGAAASKEKASAASKEKASAGGKEKASAGSKEKASAGSKEKASPGSLREQSQREPVFCPDCGLQKKAGGAAGSITGYLFQDTRCKCAPEGQAADDEMARKFWKLRQTDGGQTFNNAEMTGSSKPAAHSNIDLLPGAVIGGIYKIQRLIGVGGMGEIYLAQNLSLAKTCALKLIPPHQVTESGWQRFQQEAKSIAGLNHVNLVQVTDLGIHEGCLPYLAMEYVDGQNLAQLLDEKGPIPLSLVLDIFMQVCDGIDYAHRKGLVHRDIKPANIMLVNQANRYTVKILDFGLVKLVQKDRHQQSLTSVGDVFGSPFYMSPEQCMGEKVDNRSDIYSVGCSLFQCLTGKPPFVGDHPVAILQQHQTADPPSLDSIVGPGGFPESMELVMAKLLRKNPVERYQTLLELRGDLEKIARGEEVQPFYLSRTKPMKSNTAASTLSDAHWQSQEPQHPLLDKKFLFMAAALVLVTSGYGLFSIAKKKTPESKMPVIFENPPNTPGSPHEFGRLDLQAAPASLKDNTPFRSVIKEKGKTWQVFKFPNDVVIGDLRTVTRVSKHPAKGVVKLPLEEKVEFWPSSVPFQYPAYLKRFRAGDIWKLVIDPVNLLSDQSSDQALEQMTALPGIKALRLSLCEEMTNKCAPSIEKFGQLDLLDIGVGDFDADTISKLSTLQNLQELRLSTRTDVTAVLKKLKNSSKLENLFLTNTSASLDGIESLAYMPNLARLTLGRILPENQQTISKAIQIVCRAGKLETLIIQRTPLSTDDIKSIASMKNLDSLEIDHIQPASIETSTRALTYLSKAPSLAELRMRSVPLNDELLKLVKKFPKLEIFCREKAVVSPSDPLVEAGDQQTRLTGQDNATLKIVEIRFRPTSSARKQRMMRFHF